MGADFVAILRARFPNVPVIYGDARYVESLLNEVQVAPAKAVISSLPMLSLPRCERHEILAQAFMLLQPGGVMVQFTYGPASPIDSELAYRLDIVGERADWILGNVPPASIWRYQQSNLNTFNPE